MAIKQHCDICDVVIPGDESFRVIRYGRGQNLDIQTGNNPKIICKVCWNKMWAAVSTDQPKDPDAMISSTYISKAEAREIRDEVSKNKDAINDLHSIIKGTIRSDVENVGPTGIVANTCKNCRHSTVPAGSEPCNTCSSFSRWEAKNG